MRGMMLKKRHPLSILFLIVLAIAAVWLVGKPFGCTAPEGFRTDAPPPLPAAPATDPALNRPALAPEPQDFTPLTLPEVTVKEERIPDRSSRIVALREAGMDRLHIAKQLSVTLSEVDLVLGIAAQKK